MKAKMSATQAELECRQLQVAAASVQPSSRHARRFAAGAQPQSKRQSTKSLQPIPEHAAVTQPQNVAAATAKPSNVPAMSPTAVSQITPVETAASSDAASAVCSKTGRQSSNTQLKPVSAAQSSSKISHKKRGSKADSAHTQATSNASSAVRGKPTPENVTAASARPRSALPPQSVDVQPVLKLAHGSVSKQVRFADPISTVLGVPRKTQQRQQAKSTLRSSASGALVGSTSAAASAKAPASKKMAAVTAAAGASGPAVAAASRTNAGPPLPIGSPAQPGLSTASHVSAAQSAGNAQSAASAMLPSTNGELVQHQWKQLLNATPHAAASASQGHPATEHIAGQDPAARGIACAMCLENLSCRVVNLVKALKQWYSLQST